MSDPQGYYNGGFGLGLSARDLAKIGFLYLNKGYWNGQSIVFEYWVKESTNFYNLKGGNKWQLNAIEAHLRQVYSIRKFYGLNNLHIRRRYCRF
jgi:CubicO group peptidase (beta-lactamase class C family)